VPSGSRKSPPIWSPDAIWVQAASEQGACVQASAPKQSRVNWMSAGFGADVCEVILHQMNDGALPSVLNTFPVTVPSATL
jgi:hypothetical protein